MEPITTSIAIVGCGKAVIFVGGAIVTGLATALGAKVVEKVDEKISQDKKDDKKK